MSPVTTPTPADPSNAPEPGKNHQPAKLAARFQSLTRGLKSEHGQVPAHLADAVARHHRMLIEFYHPANDHQSWLLEQVADAAARLDHCQVSLRAELDDMADRAELCWNEDRKRAAEETASLLKKNPSRTVARLRETPQGCQWVLDRWNALGVSLAENLPWNEDQCNLAAQLMGVGPDLRPLYPTLNPSATAEDHTALMREHVDSVHTLMVDALEPLDAKARELTRMGYPLRPSKEFLRLQRQESKLRKVYNDALNAFRQARAEGPAAAASAANSHSHSEPIACLTPDPKPVPLPLASGHDRLPESAPELVQESECDADSPFEGRPVMAMLAALVESARNPVPTGPSLVSLVSALPQPTSARNRKARRALEKAARKRNRQAMSR